MADSVNNNFSPPVQLLISSLPVKVFLKNLEYLCTGKTADSVPQAKNGCCYAYRILPCLFSLQVSSNMSGEKGH